MASYFKRKDSPFYWIRFQRPDGTWGQRSSRVRDDEKGALRKIHHLVADQTSKESLHANDGSAALFNRWVPAWLDRKYSNPETLRRMKSSWSHLSTFLNMYKIHHPQEVTYTLCHDYAQWRTSEAAALKERRKVPCMDTVLTELKALRAIQQEAVRRDWIISNPCTKLGLNKGQTKEKRAITKDEETLIFAKLRTMKAEHAWMIDAFLVGMRQGCRLAEVEVPLEQIDTTAMTVRFRIKGGRFHAAPLHKDLLPLVKRAKHEGRKVLVKLGNSPSSAFCKIFQGLGMDLCFHCTRVTVVTRLCEAGATESQSMAYVGHSSTLVHSLYRKMRPVAVASLGDFL